MLKKHIEKLPLEKINSKEVLKQFTIHFISSYIFGKNNLDKNQIKS